MSDNVSPKLVSERHPDRADPCEVSHHPNIPDILGELMDPLFVLYINLHKVEPANQGSVECGFIFINYGILTVDVHTTVTTRG